MAEESESLGVATTALFVELVVIGCGTASAGALVLASIVGWGWLSFLADAGPLSLFLLAPVYVLGIIVDRVADRAGQKLTQGWRAEAYPEGVERYVQDLIGVLEVAPLSSRLSYGRSRLRVCRGWFLNGALAVPALAAYVLSLPRGTGRVAPFWAGEAALAVLIAGCLYSWASLAKTQSKQVRVQAAYLMERGRASTND